MILQFFAYLEARALLHPLLRFNLPVPVQVGAEVAVAADADIGKVLQQLCHQQTEGRALFRRAGVLGISVAVKPALIADADGMFVVAAAMRTGLFQGAGTEHCAVLADVVMVADTLETAAAMCRQQVVLRQATVFACGGAMHHDVVDFSHWLVISC